MLVVTTSASKDRRVKIHELGKIVGPGVKFEVSPERFRVLAGNNRYRVRFVEAVGEVPAQVVEEVQVSTPEPVTPVKEEVPVVEENPEIWVIEPGKDPVQVDENLEPIKEEVVEEEKPKKKRGRKKKTEVSENE